MKKTKWLMILSAFIIFTASALGVSAQSNGNYQVRKVIIDPGHGGKDPGALGKKTKEKNLTMAISKKLGDYIEQNVPGVEVEYTRTTDKYISLADRAVIINNSGADVLISIHINANKNTRAYGTSTYVSGNARDEENLEIQRQENGGEDLRDEDFIIMAQVQKQNHANSTLLAGKIQNQFRTRAGRRDNGVRQANFAVLWRANMTAVLIECGFISNANEEKYMATDEGQAYLASAIYRAFKEYKAAVEGTQMPEPPAEKPSAAKQGTSERQTQQEPKAAEPKAAEQKAAEQKAAENTPQPEKDNDDKIYFRVQVKSSVDRISLSSTEFKGLRNIEEIKMDAVYKYTVGKTQDFGQILKIQSQTREKIKDAFVIATKGDKRMDLNEAKKALGVK